MVVASIKLVAARLGNTPAVCRASYVHPAIIDAYLAGGLSAAEVDEPDDASGLRARGAAAAALPRCILRRLKPRDACALTAGAPV